VLDLRWDYYWQDHHPEGIGVSWLNRVTESSRIGFCDQCEKGDCLGTNCPGWEGCLGQGFENRVPGFTKREDLWLAVERKGTVFHLYCKYGSDANWTEVVPKSAGTQTYPAMDLVKLQGGFAVPEAVDNLVYAGFTVVGVQYGEHDMWAKIDNIKLEVGDVPSITALKTDVAKKHDWNVRPLSDGIHLDIPTGAKVSSVLVSDVAGRRIAASGRTVDQSLTLKPRKSLASGMYMISIRTEDGARNAVPLMIP
jgi:hypothetical protein